jgi:hypothetical protein
MIPLLAQIDQDSISLHDILVQPLLHNVAAAPPVRREPCQRRVGTCSPATLCCQSGITMLGACTLCAIDV